MTGISRRFLAQAALVHLALALVLNAPVLTGKVPLTLWGVNIFPPWEGVPEASVKHQGNAGTGDLITAIYPWRDFAAKSLKSGTLPTWNPYLLGGTPYIANAQSAVFYPPNWLYLLMPTAAAWSILRILHMAGAGFFTAVLTRGLGAHPLASFVAGLIFTTSGFMIAWQGFPLDDAATWLPLALFAVFRLSETPRASSVILLAVATAMPFLAGHPETAAHISMAVGALALVRWFQIAPGPGVKRRYLTALVCSAIFSVGLAACQIFPTVEWLRYITISLDLRWPAAPFRNVLTFLSRDLRHHPNSMGLNIPEEAAYAGVIALVLASLAFIGNSRRFALFFGALGAIAACLVYGVQPIRWLSTMTPVLSGLKNGRLLFVVDLSLAVLAGLGFSRWMERAHSKRAIAVTLMASAIAVLGLWKLDRLEQPMTKLADSSALTGVFLAAGVAVILLGSAGKLSSRAAPALLLLLVAADGVSSVYGFVSFVPPAAIYPRAPVFDFLKTHVRPWDRIGTLDIVIPVNGAMNYGLRSIDGYDLELKNVGFLLEDLAEDDYTGVVLHSRPVTSMTDQRLDMLSVRYFVASAGSPGLAKLEGQPERYSPVFSEGSMRVFENRRAQGAANLVPVSKVETVSSQTRHLVRLKQPDFNASSTAILAVAPRSFPSGTATGKEQVVESIEGLDFVSDHERRMTATATTSSVLVLNEMYFPGWKAIVDGVDQPILLANYALMAVALGPGEHEVVFKFASRTIASGIVASGVTLLAVGLLLVRSRNADSPKTTGLAAGIVALTLISAVALSEKDVTLPGKAAPPVFEVSRTEVIAGEDSYTLRIESLAGSLVTLRFSINDEKPVEYDVPLNGVGEKKFDVPAETRKGTYKFLAFRKAGTSSWTEANASLIVR